MLTTVNDEKKLKILYVYIAASIFKLPVCLTLILFDLNIIVLHVVAT